MRPIFITPCGWWMESVYRHLAREEKIIMAIIEITGCSREEVSKIVEEWSVSNKEILWYAEVKGELPDNERLLLFTELNNWTMVEQYLKTKNERNGSK